ncbi:MAG TPA: carboxy terminal-processing peptidase, partial [Chitinophagaceae bacterium]|nr:carboxy terminal-processing peptidase [Chitinophagaceae bacterium]
NTDWLAAQNDKTFSLQMDKYRKEQKQFRATIAQLDSLTKLTDEISVSAVTGEENKWAEDKNKQERFNNWLKGLRKDIYLDQAVKVVGDIIGQQNIAKSKTPAEEPKKAF